MTGVQTCALPISKFDLDFDYIYNTLVNNTGYFPKAKPIIDYIVNEADCDECHEQDVFCQNERCFKHLKIICDEHNSILW